MSCLLATSLLNSCAKKQKQGGLETFLYLFNLEVNGVGVSYTYSDPEELVVSAITLPAGEVLHRVDTEKFANSFTHGVAKPNLNLYYPQTLNIVSLMDSPADLKFLIETLNAVKLGAIVYDNNGQFKILGAKKGLTSDESDSYNSGNTMEADVATTIVLSGSEVDAPFLFMDAGGEEATKAYLKTLETV